MKGKQMKNTIEVLFGVLFTLLGTGCYSSWDIAPKSLEALNGYHYPEPGTRMVVDVEGQPAPFETGTQLQFPQMPKPEKFASIQVSGPAFTGVTYPDGLPVSTDLRQLSMVRMRKFSFWKTAFAIGIPVVILSIAGGILDAVLVANANQTGDDGSSLTTAPPRRK